MLGFSESNTKETGRGPFSFLLSFSSSPLRRNLVFVGFLLVPLVLIPALGHSAVVILEWSPNPEPDLAGYMIYYGTSSGNYSWSVNVGNYTSCAISDSRFEDGQTYYFAATAYDDYGNESGYSAEVTYTFSAADTDGDGIADYDEINEYGTDPRKMDTDSDGLNDGDELTYWGEEWNADYDGDGLLNLLDRDSDGDGQSDGMEFNRGFDPSDPNSKAVGICTVPIKLVLGLI